MFTSPIIDVLFLCALLFIWLTLFYHAILAVKGYNYYKFITAQGEKLMSKIENLPAVSVLVPAKNEGSVLSATINALLELDYPKDKIELVIINDGSTDGTKEILDDYASKFLRVKPVHIPPTGEFHGKAAALNEGLKHCRFDYIAVLTLIIFRKAYPCSILSGPSLTIMSMLLFAEKSGLLTEIRIF